MLEEVLRADVELGMEKTNTTTTTTTKTLGVPEQARDELSLG